MANWIEPTPERLAEWDEWKRGRPACVLAVADRIVPWKLYRMKSSGHRVTIISYSEMEDDTCKLQVAVTGEYNRVLFSRRVFGVDPDDLEECDLPAPGEDVGDTSADAGYTDDDVKNILIPELKKRGAFAGPCSPGGDCDAGPKPV